MNVEYVEREDEFDLDETGRHAAADGGSMGGDFAAMDHDQEVVDVITVEPVPVFASDSENEEEVFSFETKIKNILVGRGRNRDLTLPRMKDGDDL